MTEYERYFKVGLDAGCPSSQMRNLWSAGVILQSRQLAASAAARLCDRPDGPTAVGYGGARGGGKSHWLLAQMGADDCQRVPGLKCLLLRKVGKSNIENFQDLRLRIFSKLKHEFSSSRATLTFANGSRIIAGHFQNESDIDAYLGLEYDAIGIEEATTLSSRKHTDISTCCRTSKPNWRPRIYSTTNPGGVGHAWYRKMFILPHLERQRSGPSTLNSQPSTIFIPARVTDNQFNNPEYHKVLEALTGWQKRAWLDGDWDIAAGQFFSTFRRDLHVVDDFDERLAGEWFAALDYGFNHPTVVLLACKDRDGRIFIVDEHAERLWLPQRHAAAVKAMLARHQMNGAVAMRGVQRLSLRTQDEIQHRPLALSDLQRFVAGTDVFGRQSDGTTVAAQYAREGIVLRPANMDRVNGWAEILQRLGDPAAGIPSTLFIHRRCARLLETLPALQHDPGRPEDILKMDMEEDGLGGDDAADALRYAVATKPRLIYQCKLRGL